MRDLVKEAQGLDTALQHLEHAQQFSGEADAGDTYLDIQAGSGGREAESWAGMLLRMYLRWGESHGLQTQLVNYFANDNDGIKSASVLVSGSFAHGWLRTETGIHRLVRCSPYDSANKIHTSFASVFVAPVIDETFDIALNDADLESQTYKASGPGGQYVNKTESAIRIRHIPSGIVVACQSERSQHSNRATALKMLKAKLHERELTRRAAKAQSVEDSKSEASWGQQIRSYVLPQSRVTDARTGHESRDVRSVLDGDLTPFLRASLCWKSKL